MKSISAREANQYFSRVLGEAEAGEEILITRHGKPVAALRRYDPAMSPAQRQAAAEHAIQLMANAPRLGTPRRFTPDEMHEQ